MINQIMSTFKFLSKVKSIHPKIFVRPFGHTSITNDKLYSAEFVDAEIKRKYNRINKLLETSVVDKYCNNMLRRDIPSCRKLETAYFNTLKNTLTKKVEHYSSCLHQFD